MAEIEARLARLTSFSDVTWAEYQKSVAIRDQVERNFEVHDSLNHLGDIRAYVEQTSSHLTATGQF